MNLPAGRTHFRMPVYGTLDEWQRRAEHLRKQILSAAGLLPLPEKTPLHPQIFGRIEKDGYSVERLNHLTTESGSGPRGSFRFVGGVTARGGRATSFATPGRRLGT